MLETFTYMHLFGLSYTQAMQDPPDVKKKMLEMNAVKNEVQEEKQRKAEQKAKKPK